MPAAYIVDCVRTAGGRRNGRLSGWHPADLAAETLDALVARSGVDPVAVEDVILGCVTQAGSRRSPSRGTRCSRLAFFPRPRRR